MLSVPGAAAAAVQRRMFRKRGERGERTEQQTNKTRAQQRHCGEGLPAIRVRGCDLMEVRRRACLEGHPITPPPVFFFFPSFLPIPREESLQKRALLNRRSVKFLHVADETIVRCVRSSPTCPAINSPSYPAPSGHPPCMPMTK